MIKKLLKWWQARRERQAMRVWFRMHRKLVPDLYKAVGSDPFLQFKKGYVYPGGLWMQIVEWMPIRVDGRPRTLPQYYTILGNQELQSPSLKRIEDLLFNFYMTEIHNGYACET